MGKQAARVGRTFRYTDKGPEGLLKGKRVYVLTARGGNYRGGTPAAAFDHQMPYLKTVLGFIGLDDIRFIHAHGVA
jgi:FMN-dependent NADH-azoreductase